MVYYNVMVNISMCYNNVTIVNMYWHICKLVYKIIVNGGGYRIIYFVAGYWIYSPYIYPYIYIINEIKKHLKSLKLKHSLGNNTLFDNMDIWPSTLVIRASSLVWEA